ncbi:folate receptor gamma-like isoform X2 [Oratosquilla oratoria]|uniref:folate receptor gamma-like isoform X2 n=1 Tax=Oratosquilla oratoria TaxID=337810 RepID=UPI003F759A61
MTPTSRKVEWLAFWVTMMAVMAVKPSHAQLEKLTNWCLDGEFHKSEPGPEDILFGQCTPWKSRSCCTSSVTFFVHSGNLFNLNHCPDKPDLSRACRRHFLQDQCFYECSPNIGPWVVKGDGSWRKERYHKVPLCASDCDTWFKDCADDYTCTDNWSRNFEWVDGTNKCPVNSSCYTYREIYRTAQTFCETIWDDAWKYTSNKEPCMRLWFDGSNYNPNDNVARIVAERLVKMDTLNSATMPQVLYGYIA